MYATQSMTPKHPKHQSKSTFNDFFVTCCTKPQCFHLKGKRAVSGYSCYIGYYVNPVVDVLLIVLVCKGFILY